MGFGRKTGRKKTGDYYDTLRAQFAGKASARAAASFAAPPDPADRYFGAAPAAEEAAPARLFDPAGVQEERGALAARLSGFERAETAMLAQTLRLAVAVLWLALAGAYVLADPAAHGGAMARLFGVVGAVGAGAALVGAGLIHLLGRSSTRRLHQDAAALGRRLAAETRALEAAPAHRLNPVEAEAFLKSAAFTAGGEAGPGAFRQFLKRSASGGVAARMFLGALVLVIAAALALFAAPHLALAPAWLAAFPAAYGALAVGAVLYLSAGMIAATLGAGLNRASAAKAECAAYEAARTAFEGADGAPTSSLTARLFGAGEARRAAAAPDGSAPFASAGPAGSDSSGRGAPGARYGAPAPYAPAPYAAASDDWRSRESGPRFVDAGFQASPKSFRVDAFSKKFHTP